MQQANFPQPTGDLQWYVVQTKRHREEIAQLSLASDGVRVYLPRSIQWPRPAVGGEIGPLFPSYIFVQIALPEDYYRVVWKPGVKEFIRCGPLPTALPDGAIDFLRSREGRDGLIRCGEERRDVQIINGPLRGLRAVVERRLSKRQRVVLLMDLLQRQTRVEVPEQWVKLA